MPSLNKVMLIGHLGRDPELRYTDSGTAVCNINLATSDKFKTKDGEWKERTEWHRIVTWARTAEVCGEYLKKGDAAYFEGRLETRKWEDKEGVTKYTTEIVAERMVMLGKRGESASEPPAMPGETKSDDDGLPF